MIIYEMDVDEELDRLKSTLNYTYTLRDSFAFDRSSYRDFAKELKMDFDIFDQWVPSMERKLLIDTYTFSEQLFKNFYYHLIEKGNCSNQHIRQYFDYKLDVESFSPNVKYELIEKNIRKELIPGFFFVFSHDNEKIKKYDRLVGSRHRYAHGGLYDYQIEDYREVIQVEEYLYNELRFIVEKGVTARGNYCDLIATIYKHSEEIVKRFEEYKKERNDYAKKDIKKKYVALRRECRAILKIDGSPLQCNLLCSIKNEIEIISKVKLTNFSDACVKVENMHTLFSNEKITRFHKKKCRE